MFYFEEYLSKLEKFNFILEKQIPQEEKIKYLKNSLIRVSYKLKIPPSIGLPLVFQIIINFSLIYFISMVILILLNKILFLIGNYGDIEFLSKTFFLRSLPELNQSIFPVAVGSMIGIVIRDRKIAKKYNIPKWTEI